MAISVSLKAVLISSGSSSNAVSNAFSSVRMYPSFAVNSVDSCLSSCSVSGIDSFDSETLSRSVSTSLMCCFFNVFTANMAPNVQMHTTSAPAPIQSIRLFCFFISSSLHSLHNTDLESSLRSMALRLHFWQRLCPILSNESPVYPAHHS